MLESTGSSSLRSAPAAPVPVAALLVTQSPPGGEEPGRVGGQRPVRAPRVRVRPATTTALGGGRRPGLVERRSPATPAMPLDPGSRRGSSVTEATSESASAADGFGRLGNARLAQRRRGRRATADGAESGWRSGRRLKLPVALGCTPGRQQPSRSSGGRYTWAVVPVPLALAEQADRHTVLARPTGRPRTAPCAGHCRD